MNLNTAKISAILFNLGVILFFAQALIFPEVNAQWIFRGALLIFIFEFLSIFTNVGSLKMKGKTEAEEQVANIANIGKAALFIGVSFGFAVLFSYVTGNIYAAGYFILSTVIRLFNQQKNEKDTDFVVTIVGIMVTLMIAAWATPLWAFLFPFPDEVLSQRIDGSSGSFVDTPQSLLIWGILYFGLMIWYELSKEEVEAWIERNKNKNPRV